jgi:hypothetical protein
MASTEMIRAEIEAIDEEERVAEAIAAAVGSTAFGPFRDTVEGQRQRDEWRTMARMVIAIRRAQE